MAVSRVCKIEHCNKSARTRGWCNGHYLRWLKYGDPLIGKDRNWCASEFFRDVVLPYDGDECLIWPYRRNLTGYAQIWSDGRAHNVQRLVCERHLGPPPSDEYEAAHSCGSGHLGCVAPKHLRWATRAENQADRVAHGTSNRGERQWASKLTSTDVKRIRKMTHLTPTEIARSFGVTRAAIDQILRRQTWAWLE